MNTAGSNDVEESTIGSSNDAEDIATGSYDADDSASRSIDAEENATGSRNAKEKDEKKFGLGRRVVNTLINPLFGRGSGVSAKQYYIIKMRIFQNAFSFF